LTNASDIHHRSALRELPGPPIGDDYDMWEDCEPEDRLVRREDILKVEVGQKFYTTPSRGTGG
jgi:hypothetical protein